MWLQDLRSPCSCPPGGQVPPSPTLHKVSSRLHSSGGKGILLPPRYSPTGQKLRHLRELLKVTLFYVVSDGVGANWDGCGSPSAHAQPLQAPRASLSPTGPSYTEAERSLNPLSAEHPLSSSEAAFILKGRKPAGGSQDPNAGFLSFPRNKAGKGVTEEEAGDESKARGAGSSEQSLDWSVATGGLSAPRCPSWRLVDVWRGLRLSRHFSAHSQDPEAAPWLTTSRAAGQPRGRACSQVGLLPALRLQGCVCERVCKTGTALGLRDCKFTLVGKHSHLPRQAVAGRSAGPTR